MLWLGDTEGNAFMWEVQGEARAEGLLPGREQNTAIIRQGSAGRKLLLTHRKLNWAGIGPGARARAVFYLPLSTADGEAVGTPSHPTPAPAVSA